MATVPDSAVIVRLSNLSDVVVVAVFNVNVVGAVIVDAVVGIGIGF